MRKNDPTSPAEANIHHFILDSIPTPILEVNQNLVISFANKETHCRWKSITEGKTFFCDLFSPGTPNRGEQILGNSFRLKAPQTDQIETPEGDVFEIRSNYIQEKDTPGVIVHIIDISDRAQLEKKVEMISKKHHDQLLQADKMISLGILASGMAHEINNPNNSIMLNISVLQKTWNSIIPILNECSAEKEDLRIGGVKYEKMKGKIPLLFSGIIESSKKIQRIVKDLKYFSGQDLISLKNQVDMESIAQSAISLTTNMIHKSTRNFKAVFEKNLPNVMGNFQNLEQVIINLVQNACQALETPENGIFITITYDRKAGEIVTRVKDEGVGIPEKDLKYITEPFFTSKRSSGGTGLGLYVSSKIINDHGGTLRFYSSLGEGTTVEVRLRAIDTA